MVGVAKLRLYEFVDNLPEWNEIGKSVVNGDNIEIEICMKNGSAIVGRYVFQDFRYISFSSQSDRLMEIYENSRMEGPFGYNICIYDNSDLLKAKASVPGIRSYTGCLHYVIVDDDTWIDVISGANPIFKPYLLDRKS